MPLGGLLVIGYVLYEMDSTAKVIGACWIAAGSVNFVVLTCVLRKPVALQIAER
jgi:hypothetical protein